MPISTDGTYATYDAEAALTVLWGRKPLGLEPPPPPPVPTAADPMDLDRAIAFISPLLRDYVMARKKVDRELTHRDYYQAKHSFRTTYGTKAWKEAYDWIVQDWDLYDFIFDYDALRDS